MPQATPRAVPQCSGSSPPARRHPAATGAGRTLRVFPSPLLQTAAPRPSGAHCSAIHLAGGNATGHVDAHFVAAHGIGCAQSVEHLWDRPADTCPTTIRSIITAKVSGSGKAPTSLARAARRNRLAEGANTSFPAVRSAERSKPRTPEESGWGTRCNCGDGVLPFRSDLANHRRRRGLASQSYWW